MLNFGCSKPHLKKEIKQIINRKYFRNIVEVAIFSMKVPLFLLRKPDSFFFFFFYFFLNLNKTLHKLCIMPFFGALRITQKH